MRDTAIAERTQVGPKRSLELDSSHAGVTKAEEGQPLLRGAISGLRSIRLAHEAKKQVATAAAANKQHERCKRINPQWRALVSNLKCGLIAVRDGLCRFTGQASDATNCRTDSNLLINASGSARPTHWPSKFYSNQHHGTDYHSGCA